jgi:hypothetical protein
MVAPTSSSSPLSILPLRHLSGGTGPVGAATNPGLVSPIDSQPDLRKDVLLSVTSLAVPALQQQYSSASAGPMPFQYHERPNVPAPIIPRPPGMCLHHVGFHSSSVGAFSHKAFLDFFHFSATGTVILPDIDSSTADAAAITFDLGGPVRLNRFVRRLHDMLVIEKESGIVEWRRGLLVLFSTDAFTQKILPKYFNTRNFKTFRRQVRRYMMIENLMAGV